MDIDQDKPQEGYSLDFLKHPERDFKSEMIKYIQTRFTHLLDEEDLKYLAQGDVEFLERLSKKCQAAYHAEKIMDV